MREGCSKIRWGGTLKGFAEWGGDDPGRGVTASWVSFREGYRANSKRRRESGKGEERRKRNSFSLKMKQDAGTRANKKASIGGGRGRNPPITIEHVLTKEQRKAKAWGEKGGGGRGSGRGGGNGSGWGGVVTGGGVCMGKEGK